MRCGLASVRIGSRVGRHGPCSIRASCVGLGNERIAFRVCHDEPRPNRNLVCGSQRGCAKLDEPLDIFKPVEVQIEVDAILGQLWLGHTIKPDCRSSAWRIDDDGRVRFNGEACRTEAVDLRLIVRANRVAQCWRPLCLPG